MAIIVTLITDSKCRPWNLHDVTETRWKAKGNEFRRTDSRESERRTDCEKPIQETKQARLSGKWIKDHYSAYQEVDLLSSHLAQICLNSRKQWKVVASSPGETLKAIRRRRSLGSPLFRPLGKNNLGEIAAGERDTAFAYVRARNSATFTC